MYLDNDFGIFEFSIIQKTNMVEPKDHEINHLN